MFDVQLLRAEWKRAGYKDYEIAEKIKMTPQNLSTIVNGKNGKLSADQAAHICNLINKPMDMFKVSV